MVTVHANLFPVATVWEMINRRKNIDHIKEKCLLFHAVFVGKYFFFKYEYRKIISWHLNITSKSCSFCCFICFSSENNIFSSTSKQREFPKTFFCDNKNWNCPKKLFDIFLLVSMEHLFDFKNQLKHEWTLEGLPVSNNHMLVNVFFNVSSYFYQAWRDSFNFSHYFFCYSYNTS